MEQKQLHTNFLALKFDERYFGPQILFYAIWNKGFWDHADLTDGMQWQKKSKILMHFIFWMCSVRVNAALDGQRLEKDL